MLNRDLDQHLQAESLYERALDICKQTLGSIHPNVSTNLSDIAMLFSKQENYFRAEPLYLGT